MSSKRALKLAQKQNYARYKNNFSSNSSNPFSKKKIKVIKIKNKNLKNI